MQINGKSMRINLSAPWNNLSYGLVAQNIVRELHKLKTEISYFPIGQPENCGDLQLLNHVLKNQEEFHQDSPCLRIFHQFALAEHISRPYYGFPIFELDSFTNLEKRHLGGCDHLFVTSKWAKSIVDKELGDENFSTVAPLGVDTNIFKPTEIINKRNPTIFLNIGKYEYRKGHDVIVELFSSAFTKSDNTFLFLMIENPFSKREEIQQFVHKAKNSPMGDRIEFIPPTPDIVRIMNEATCGLFPSRGEGWLMPGLEMMACGKPIIVTNYSAQTEYCNSQNSFLVNVDDMEEAYDGKFFRNDGRTNTGKWAKLEQNQFEQFVEHMRTVHKTKQESGVVANSAGIDTAKKFSWENTARIIYDITHN